MNDQIDSRGCYILRYPCKCVAAFTTDTGNRAQLSEDLEIMESDAKLTLQPIEKTTFGAARGTRLGHIEGCPYLN